MLKTFKITFSGQVQGVGFRPYVYKVAQKFKLKGNVSNNEKGVLIYVTGEKQDIELFYRRIYEFPPQVAVIKKQSINEVDFIPFSEFKIISSQKNGQLNVPLTPDFAICEDCKKEIENPENRRYQYPFTTCVNCGPRWAITQTFPFERANTSIHEFHMCNACENEYVNPENRRFHSQTNTCETCGISMWLTDNSGKKLENSYEIIFKKTAQLLEEGKIIAIKNTSGFLLCCNAENSEVVNELRKRKNRPKKPFAVLFPSLESLHKQLHISDEVLTSLTSSERPIHIISLKNYKGKLALNQIAPGLSQLGVMMPYTGILQLLANQLKFPIIATSGNIHGSPIISDNFEALEKLNHVADYFLLHNLNITHPQDDSVLKFSYKFKQQVLFRRARGFAPNYLKTSFTLNKKVMAMGAHLKSTISFLPNQNLYVSEYIGNLANFDVYNRFVKVAEGFTAIFEQAPNVVLVDKHPLYNSTQYGKELAQEKNLEYIEIQHHKAHFTAILGEYDLWNEKVLGVVFDGTGFGDDAQIWGGEFFDYSYKTIKRIQHVDYFDWLLGDKMSAEPRLSLLALASSEMELLLAEKFKENELKTYKHLLKSNKLKTSSVGRLFDAAASLLNISDFNSYEAEAPILLENIVESYSLNKCKSYITDYASISAKTILKNMYADKMQGVSVSEMAANFLFTLAKIIMETAVKNKYQKVALSGGIFQNTTLVDMLLELAPKEIKLYFHRDLSPNDENISFGQIMYYLKIKN